MIKRIDSGNGLGAQGFLFREGHAEICLGIDLLDPRKNSLVFEMFVNYQAAHDISKPLDSLTLAEQGAVLTRVCKQIKAAVNPQ